MAAAEIFSRIRVAAEEVSRRARFVRIVPGRLESLADELAVAADEPAVLDPAHHFVGDPDATLAYVVTLDAINFGSGWFPTLRKRPGCSGYMTIATALKEHFETAGAFDAAALRKLAAADCAAVLGQDVSRPAVAQLMAHFARAWNDLGKWLESEFGGQFTAAVEAANHSAAQLVSSLGTMPLYRDEARYDELTVPFYKRAQLTVADLSIALSDDPRGRFDDLSDLTIFADNLVPHVLRWEGVLAYEAGLAARIDAEERLEPGSPEEVEIRAVALHAVERMVAAARSSGHAVTAQRLDYLLWNRGQQPAMKAHPRHRARSVFY